MTLGGIEVYAPDGRLLFDGAGRYPRIVDAFELTSDGERAYVEIDPSRAVFMLMQGGSPAYAIEQNGNRVRWWRPGVAPLIALGSGSSRILVVTA